ncbi:MAG: hypothetical protein CMN58_01090 [Solibacterales bacterium]|nr:hypothetical protein [Bryobacterales bacterium]
MKFWPNSDIVILSSDHHQGILIAIKQQGPSKGTILPYLQQLRPLNPLLISVRVVTHNRPDLLKGCLESLHCQLYRSFELIVVDNGAQNNSANLLKYFLFSDVQTIENKCNYMFLFSNNQDLDLCKETYISLLNNDAAAETSWPAELIGKVS